MLIVGIVSIGLLFAYTWIHSGNLLARYVDPSFIGFVAAAGIELSIIGLSMRIGELRRSGLNTKFFKFTLIAVVAVSAAANIAEGFYVRYHEPLTISNFQRLDIVEAIVLVGATGLISLVTLALSELIGQDVNAAQKAQKKSDAKTTGGYEILPNTPEELPEPEEPLKLESPREEKPKIEAFLPDEEFARRMNELGDAAPKSISEVMAVFSLSHATAQRRLAKYRGEK
jgi:hypothetical protein